MAHIGEDRAENRFIQAKNALLAHYSSQQTSQGARLVGSAVILLTLLQATDSRIQHLFPNLVSCFSNILPSTAGWDLVRLAVFFVLVTFIIAFMFYTIGRFSVFAQFSQEVMYVTFEDAEKRRSEEEVKKRRRKEALHEAIHAAARDQLKTNNPKLLWVFREKWFVSMDEGSESVKGLACSILIGIPAALALMWLLW
jgi:hypothetical protein